MNLELQVCTLEQSKRLVELEISPRLAYFRWYVGIEKRPLGNPPAPRVDSMIPFDLRMYKVESFPVYTGTELGQLLPGELWDIDPYRLVQFQCDTDGVIEGYKCWYQNEVFRDKRVPDDAPIYGSTEAQSRAAMLIYLLENEEVKPDWLHQRCGFVE